MDDLYKVAFGSNFRKKTFYNKDLINKKTKSKKNNLIIKKHLNKNYFYCKDNIIFNNLIWYNYYLNKNLSKYKIRQKHI